LGIVQTLKAHRLSWRFHHGPIPDGLAVLHKCDNPRCVNPEHLFLGTLADNNADTTRKGRWRPARGERSGKAKLTAQTVRDLRAKCRNWTDVVEWARRLGVSKPTILNAWRGDTWKHV